MNRFVAGAVASLLLAAAGLVWWQGRGTENRAALIAQPLPAPRGEALPGAGDPKAIGKPPPPEATPRTREEKRFDRFDHNRDNIIVRNEMMVTRANDFRKLDKDGNNLLSFEEWAVKTSDRFAGADGNKDGKLSRAEFATTAVNRKAAGQPNCSCNED